jgi:hypothetical protein
MILRRLPLFAIAALAGLTTSAFADGAFSGGVPLGTSNNLTIGNNIAAGIDNSAQQKLHTTQTGTGSAGGIPLVSTNTTVGTNVAAGIGNDARQKINSNQSGAPLVTYDWSGRGPLVTTNVDVGTNVAAGIGNLATQRLKTRQR